MMRIHAQLKAGEYPNCRKLAEELEVSTKTIQRDIDFMRDQLGLPIEYDQLHFGFIYTRPVPSFPRSRSWPCSWPRKPSINTGAPPLKRRCARLLPKSAKASRTALVLTGA